jgi:general secretion pathway protein D
MKRIITLLAFILAAGNVYGQTIAQKKAGLSGSVGDLNPEMQKYLNDVNNELRERHEELVKLQRQVMQLYLHKAPPESYHELLLHINDIKENIRILEESWREMVTKPGVREEGYALWHQPETTLEQIVLDYGASEFVYLIPIDIGSIQVSLNSNIPIPRAAWGQMLEQILLQNGVGIKEVNPYLRELYTLKGDFSDLRLITNDARDLEAFPSNARVSFLLSPSPEDVRRIWFFLEKFINPNATVIQRFGRVILIVGEVSAVKDLLKVYDFIAANKQELEYRAVPLSRVDAEEMAKILTSIFQEFEQDVEVETTSEPLKNTQTNQKQSQVKSNPAVRPSPSAQMKPLGGSNSNQRQNQKVSNSLSVTALPKMAQAVFLVGTKDEIAKAIKIIQEVESQVGAARDKEIFWYKVKHSEPEELAVLLDKIYQVMIENRVGYQKPEAPPQVSREKETFIKETNTQKDTTIIGNPLYPPLYPGPGAYAGIGNNSFYPQDNFYQQGGYVINPRPAEPRSIPKMEYNKNRNNFLVDPKTSTIVMVVEVDLIAKLKELLSKIDVPKKQVQIECLLFERRNRKQNNYGLNLLRVGSSASQTHVSALNFNDVGNLGILELLLSRAKSETGIPSFDISYKFLMSQDDVHINACPTVVTVNQVPASIVINEEISINTGVYQVPTSGGVTLQDSFTRAQYGINISVTPTIHMVDDEDCFLNPENYVHLVTDITFDTFTPTLNQQPDVTRRHITNEVNIVDGQTVVIGGLRRENTRDSTDKIPFLGEIPGLGKLFSTTELTDDDTEMFIFITPKIVYDQNEDFMKLRAIDLSKRPGDLPSFLANLNEALECEKRRLLQGSLIMLFGLPHPRYIDEEGEYDGRYCR